MVYPAHVLYSARGSILGGEQWSCGLRQYTPTGDYAGLDLIAAAEESFQAWYTFFGIGGLFSTQVTLDHVDAYVYDDAENLVEQARSTSVGRAGVGTRNLPNQCTVVASLRTETPGRSGRGRIFLPVLAVPFVDTGRLEATVTLGLAEDVADLVVAHANAGFGVPTVGIFTAVVSRTTGLGHRITRVDVGDVIDTQRRRRNELDEVVQSWPVDQPN